MVVPAAVNSKRGTVLGLMRDTLDFPITKLTQMLFFSSTIRRKVHWPYPINDASEKWCNVDETILVFDDLNVLGIRRSSR